MIRYLVPVAGLGLSLGGSPATAEPFIPSWCCPNTCIADGADGSRTGFKVGRAGEGDGIPMSRNLYVGESPDNQTLVCIGFDDFGNKQVKCLFLPPVS
ncbi:MAG: hypothetical protein ACU0DK_14345 [Pseudooceanicola sp.]|uniref:hypothetical protein n=1 Tax=Pseudooceanicola nanhaiensis TaxID=375761 RepID=UPI0040589744